MKQRVRGEDATLDQAKRIADDFGPVFGRLSVKLSVDHGITERVLGVLVYARGTGTLSRRTWCFLRPGLAVGSHCFRSPSEEGVSGIQGQHEIEVFGPDAQYGVFLFCSRYSHSHFSTNTRPH